jgi:hypothetical protein
VFYADDGTEVFGTEVPTKLIFPKALTVTAEGQIKVLDCTLNDCGPDFKSEYESGVRISSYNEGLREVREAERPVDPDLDLPIDLASQHDGRLLVLWASSWGEGGGVFYADDGTEVFGTEVPTKLIFPKALSITSGVVVVNKFLEEGRVFTALERSVPGNDPHQLCPETDPNDRETWRIFAINPEFRNNSQIVSLRGLQYVVRTLSEGNTLINADDAPPAGGVGSIVTVPDSALGLDGILSPGESFLIGRQTEGEPLGIFLICLASRSPFQFFVDVWGIPIP